MRLRSLRPCVVYSMHNLHASASKTRAVVRLLQSLILWHSHSLGHGLSIYGGARTLLAANSIASSIHRNACRPEPSAQERELPTASLRVSNATLADPSLRLRRESCQQHRFEHPPQHLQTRAFGSGKRAADSIDHRKANHRTSDGAITARCRKEMSWGERFAV